MPVPFMVYSNATMIADKMAPIKDRICEVSYFVCFYLALNWPLFSSQTRAKRNSAKKLTVFLNFVKLLVIYVNVIRVNASVRDSVFGNVY